MQLIWEITDNYDYHCILQGLQACLFKYNTVAAFHIYAQCGEDVAKRGGWRPCII